MAKQKKRWFRHGKTRISRDRREKNLRHPSLEILEDRKMLATITWDGGGEDHSWSNPLNWSNDQLPSIADDVTIDVEGSVTIEYNAGSASVQSLVLAENLLISEGTLLVASNLSVDANQWIQTQGTTAWFVAEGLTSIDGVDLYAKEGGRFYFSAIQSITNVGDTTWEADGFGSQILLPNLTSYNTGNAIGQDVYVRALNGGLIDLSSLP
ncbi:hypothetical protein, partial [Blastopirellula marina]